MYRNTKKFNINLRYVFKVFFNKFYSLIVVVNSFVASYASGVVNCDVKLLREDVDYLS